MAFRNIKGQQRAVEFLRNSVNKDRLGHAYLFSGRQGLGKTLLAENLAKFLNCENPVQDKGLLVDCCDSCISCRKIEGFSHPDVHWIEARGNSKNISIDEIRLMQKEISLKTYEGKFKVFIIQDAENMTSEAANCLLKTLEEPPRFSLIILNSTNISGLLPTIISRCQVIKFSPLEYKRLKKILIEDYKFATGDAHFLSVTSEGRVGFALSLSVEDTCNKKNRIIEQICRKRWRRSAHYIFNIKDRRELMNQIGYLLNWFRDILIFKVGLSDSNIINADRIEEIKAEALAFRLQDLEQIIFKITEAHRLIQQNVNPKIALEVMLEAIARCKR